MLKSKTFQVNSGRIFFHCPVCRQKRMISIGSGVRRRSIICRRCGEKISCVLNRRQKDRSGQSGKVLMLTGGGGQAEVDLFDISAHGVGFEMDIRSGIKISVGQEIQFKCSWNSRLLSQGRYVIKSIRGVRVGAERRS